MKILRIVSLLLMAAISFGGALNVHAQVGPFEQTYRVKKSDLEIALREAHAYGGAKLPLLDGFVISSDSDLDAYQRPYYQFSLKLIPINADETKVVAEAKISAYRSGKSAVDSGYKAFESNGRLETDLFDRVQAVLARRPNSANGRTTPGVASPPGTRGGFDAALRSSRDIPAAPFPQSTTDSARIQQLTKEQSALAEILRNQSHPNDLVAVKVAHAPIFTKPQEGSQILMFADVQDEFQVLDSNPQWIHVTIAGISRGWIRRSQVEIPGTSVPSTGANGKVASFESTKEEIAAFPGAWPALKGKYVKVIWVKPNSSSSTRQERLAFGESILRKFDPSTSEPIDGVVIVFDSAEGGMMAATIASLRDLHTGSLTSSAFLQQCWFDPIEAFLGRKMN